MIASMPPAPRLRAMRIGAAMVAMLWVWAGAAAHGGHLHAMHAWARATPPGAGVGAVYLVIHNEGSETDRLVGVIAPIAERAQMHSMRMENGMMKMDRLDAVDVAPGAHVLFEPGAKHIMLTGLAHPLRPGEKFTISLLFEHAGKVEVPVVVQPIGAMGMENDDAKGAEHKHQAGNNAGNGTTE